MDGKSTRTDEKSTRTRQKSIRTDQKSTRRRRKSTRRGWGRLSTDSRGLSTGSRRLWRDSGGLSRGPGRAAWDPLLEARQKLQKPSEQLPVEGLELQGLLQDEPQPQGIEPDAVAGAKEVPEAAQLVELLIGLFVEDGRTERAQIEQHSLQEILMPGRGIELVLERFRDIAERVLEGGVEDVETIGDHDEPLLLLRLAQAGLAQLAVQPFDRLEVSP